MQNNELIRTEISLTTEIVESSASSETFEFDQQVRQNYFENCD